MSGQTTTNGNGTWKNWLIGILTTVAVSLTTGAFVTIKNHGERIAVLESQVHDVRQQLDRIEQKIDRLSLAGRASDGRGRNDLRGAP